MTIARRLGLVAGPAAAAAFYFWLPEQYLNAAGEAVAFGHAGRATLAMMAWMALWWMTEAVEIEVTALLPLVAFPLAGIAPLPATAAPYASDVVFLFLGGFVLAAAIQRFGLDRRLAFLTLRLTGARADRMVAAVLGVTAFVSMWVSNTATAAMMLPIALAVADLVLRNKTGHGLEASGGIPPANTAERNFALALVLAIAYGASLGGVATLIGTPPNGILVRFLEQTYGQAISFAEWLAIGLPVTLAFLPVAWWLLARAIYPSGLGEVAGGRQLLEDEYRRLGALSRGERVTLGVFAATAGLWVFRPLLAELSIAGMAPFARLTDAGIAMAAALALFLLPGDRAGARAMDWKTAARLPWGVLILFGGGLTLAAAVEANGVAEFLGSFTPALGGWPTLAIIVAVVALTVFLSELTSNTAQVATMLPLLAAAAPALGLPPALLLVPCTLAASCAFMLPVGTPPNAIVFGSGLVTIPQMCKAGIWLNLAGIVLITAAAYLIVVPLLVTAG
jgi:sodium-dependent dicarboxylate transporter 2/3/5